MGKAFAVGEVERWYGAWCCLVGWNWPDAWTAAVVAPGEGGPALVVMGREAVGVLWWAFCEAGDVLCGYEVAWAADWEPAAFCTWVWARKAARKPEKKGLFDDIGAVDGCWRPVARVLVSSCSRGEAGWDSRGVVVVACHVWVT